MPVKTWLRKFPTRGTLVISVDFAFISLTLDRVVSSWSSQVYTKTTDNHTEAYRMCSGGQQWWKGVGGDDGGVPSRGDTSLGADLRALGEEVGEK